MFLQSNLVRENFKHRPQTHAMKEILYYGEITFLFEINKILLREIKLQVTLKYFFSSFYQMNENYLTLEEKNSFVIKKLKSIKTYIRPDKKIKRNLR